MIKKSVLNSFSQYNVPKMALALLVALLVGIVIYCVYRRFFNGGGDLRRLPVAPGGVWVLPRIGTIGLSTKNLDSPCLVGGVVLLR